jgi:hypothetical protein
MATAVTDELAVKDAQRKGAKRATFEKLKAKRRAELEFTTTLSTEAGPEEMSFLFRALGGQDYDRLITKHPPTTEQKAKGSNYDMNTFAPALLARACIEPVMDEAEWAEIWNSTSWNAGELSGLFWSAVELCNKGLDVNPTEAG